MTLGKTHIRRLALASVAVAALISTAAFAQDSAAAAQGDRWVVTDGDTRYVLQAVRNLEDRKLLVDADNISGTYLAAYARGLPIRAGIGTGWRPHSAAGSEPPSLRKEQPPVTGASGTGAQ